MESFHTPSLLAFHCFQHRSYSGDKSIIPGTDFWERSSPLGQRTVAVCSFAQSLCEREPLKGEMGGQWKMASCLQHCSWSTLLRTCCIHQKHSTECFLLSWCIFSLHLRNQCNSARLGGCRYMDRHNSKTGIWLVFYWVCMKEQSISWARHDGRTWLMWMRQKVFVSSQPGLSKSDWIGYDLVDYI